MEVIKMTEELQNNVLVHAVCDMLRQCTHDRFCVVYLDQKVNSMEIESTSAHADPEKFHDHLRITILSGLTELEKYFHENVNSLKRQYGALLFLYSVISTKGLDQVKLECDSTDPLIDAIYGYGSQSLINLMITGRAVTYVWDHEQDVGGLKLKGLDKQSQIGFITSMEHLRYCTVGSFYKSPVHPIWVLGSDTHLTVLFSEERKLVSPETKSEQARRVFKNYDKDGNNFINVESLQAVLQELDLVSDSAYVDIMRKKLDSENLGIILLNAFMEEFFPTEESSVPDMFQLIHYNGLPISNVDGQVKYHVGSAILLESDVRSICESNPMLTCLQTKWPNIEITWWNNITPSLN
ncbi:ubiquitin carboxyl-terminal hydrolase MINDY-3 homolog isoform X2 [Onthophagus taurus]|uniref:ubiquitin carboxyl-terminal hydrolase MINDY-3 homolog isoform X2 n=1 Tax=Onthophagus taurus TaxID=166361 RepID=UPI0039BE5E98